MFLFPLIISNECSLISDMKDLEVVFEKSEVFKLYELEDLDLVNLAWNLI